jgi:hypothetical protein
MPRLAPFSTPRGSTAPSESATRPSTPFVPAWLRGYAEREDAPIAEPAVTDAHWSDAALSWHTPLQELTASDAVDSFASAAFDESTIDDESVTTIEAFLAAVELPSAELGELIAPDRSDISVADALNVDVPDEVVLAIEPQNLEVSAVDAPAETDASLADSYTLESSAAEIEALARALGEGTKRPTPVQLRAIEDAARFGLDAALVERVGPQPLPEWSDDDFIDIMPAMAMPASEPALPQGPDPQELAEEAASMLEGIAMRVRDRELSLPLFTPGMGDAAVLAAALAALLAAQ